MAIYLFVIAFICVFSLAYDGKKMDSAKKRSFYFTMFFLILLSGLRGDLGHDTVTYSNWYRNVPPIYDMTLAKYSQTRFEPLFVLLCSICKSITNEWLLPQMIFSILVNSSVLLFIKRHTESIFISILLYFIGCFYVLNCEEIRQATSFAIILFASSYLGKCEFKKYYLWVLVAVGFHYSSLLFFSIPLLMKIVKKPLWILSMVFLLFAVSSFLRAYMSDIMMALFSNNYSDYLISNIVEGTYGGEVSRSIISYMNTLIVMIVIPLLSYYFSKKKDGDDILYTFLILYVCCVIINLEIIWFYRYVHLMQIVSFVAIANGMGLLGMKKIDMVKKSLVLFMFILCFYSLVKNAIMGYDEYYGLYRYELFVPYTLYF